MLDISNVALPKSHAFGVAHVRNPRMAQETFIANTIGCTAGPERAPTTNPIPMAPTMHAMDWLNPGAMDASDTCKPESEWIACVMTEL